MSSRANQESRLTLLKDNQVRLRVENATPFPRRDELVSNGVPVPRDLRILDASELQLLDGDGHPVPAQFCALAWWPEGSIKWTLVSFLATVDAGSARDYYLQFFPKSAVKESSSELIGTSGRPGQIHVDTGAMRFVVNEAGKRPFGQLSIRTATGWADLTGRGEYIGLVVKLDGMSLYCGPIDRLSVNDNGSERVDITVSGPYVTETGRPTDLSYIIRFVAHRGGKTLRIFHSVRNMGPRVRLAGLIFQVPFQACETVICQERSKIFSCDKLSGTAIGVLQDNPDCYEIGYLDEVRTSVPGQFSGWITAKAKNGLAITATVRYFWQMYPKSLEVTPDYLQIGLLPERTNNYDSFLPGGQIKTSYELLQGETRTHEFLLFFHEADLDDSAVAEVVDQFQNPLYALAPSDWYVESGALGDLCSRDSARFPEYEHAADQSLACVLERRIEKRLYGDRNFGDDCYRTLGSWNNGEYDYPHVGMLMFLRGCGREWYDEFALPAARHMINIDIINAGPQKGRVYQHDNSYSSDVLGHTSQGHGGLSSHAWIQGILEYYAFSGDFLARDVALSVADRWADEILDRYHRVQSGDLPAEKMFGTERQWGWSNVSMMGAYNIFPEDKFFQASKCLMEIAQQLQLDNGLLGGFFERNGFAGILMGSPVMDSMVMYYQVTKSAEVRDFIVKLGRALCHYGWVDPPGAWAFHAQNRDYKMTSDRNLAPAVAYAYHYSASKDQDAVLWERAKRGFKRSWAEVAKDGKTLAQAHRFALRMLALMKIYD